MSRQIRELDGEARETRTCPSWFGGPDGQLTEERIDQTFRATREVYSECLECGEPLPLLRRKYRGEQGVFAPEVVIERAFGNVGRGCDLIDPDAKKASSPE